MGFLQSVKSITDYPFSVPVSRQCWRAISRAVCVVYRVSGSVCTRLPGDAMERGNSAPVCFARP